MNGGVLQWRRVPPDQGQAGSFSIDAVTRPACADPSTRAGGDESRDGSQEAIGRCDVTSCEESDEDLGPDVAVQRCQRIGFQQRRRSIRYNACPFDLVQRSRTGLAERAGGPGKPDQTGSEVRPDLPAGDAEPSMTDQIASHPKIAIAGVLDERECSLDSVRPDGASGDLQHGPDDRWFVQLREDPGEPFQSGTASRTEEDRFRLVVRMVRGNDNIGGRSATQALQRTIAKCSCSFLQSHAMSAAERGGVHSCRNAGETERSCEILDKRAVPIGLVSPDTVMHVSHGQAYPFSSGDLSKQVEEHDGISPAADGDEHVSGLRRQSTQGRTDEGEEVSGTWAHGRE